jgi:hypothetical protein
MTYDELKKYVSDQIDLAQLGNQPTRPWSIILYIVNMHRSVEAEYFDKAVCSACSPDIDQYRYYPCPTIQTIEMELG